MVVAEHGNKADSSETEVKNHVLQGESFVEVLM